MLFLTTKKSFLPDISQDFSRCVSQDQSPHNINVFAKKGGLELIVLGFGYWQTSTCLINIQTWRRTWGLRSNGNNKMCFRDGSRSRITSVGLPSQRKLLPHRNWDLWDFEQMWNDFILGKKRFGFCSEILSPHMYKTTANVLKAWLLFIKLNREFIGLGVIPHYFCLCGDVLP